MSQATLSTPGSPLAMTALATFLDNALAALASVQRGDPVALTPTEGMLCWDSTGTPDALKRYTVAAGWKSILKVNKTTGAVTIQDLTLTAAAVGFTLAGGTTSRTLTVDETKKLSDKMNLTGANLAIGSDANGDLYYRASAVLARLAKGTARLGLSMNSGATAPEWVASMQSLLTTAGDIIYASAANTPARLAKGTNGQYLRQGETILEWATIPEDPAAGTAGLRTLGTGALQALPGNTSIIPADGTITQAKLKTSTGSVQASATNVTLPGGEYGFYPQYIATVATDVYIAKSGTSGSYVTNIGYVGGADVTRYFKQRYVTSSGEVFWVFILRAIVDYTETDTIGELVERKAGDILSMYQAPDHPCFGNGGKPLLVSHPFGSYDPLTQEIIVINPSHEEVEKMKKMGERGEDEADKDLLEVIKENYEIDEASEPAWPTIPVTVGLPKDYEIMAMGHKVTPIKKVIPQPEGVLVKKLRRK